MIALIGRARYPAPDVDSYSAHVALANYLLSLLDRPRLRDRVSEISIDLASLDVEDRELLTHILLRADAIRRLRAPQPS